MDNAQKRYESLMGRENENRGENETRKEKQPRKNITKNKKYQEPFINPSIINKKILLESTTAGIIAAFGMSTFFDNIFEGVYPSGYFYDVRGCRHLRLHGKIMKIAALSILYMIIKIWILES